MPDPLASARTEEMAQKADDVERLKARNAELRKALRDMVSLARDLVRSNAQLCIDPMTSLRVKQVKDAEAVLRGR